MPITTRRATPDDAAPLHDLAARTFGLACPPGTEQADIDTFVATHLSVDSFTRYLADPDRIVLLALADGQPAGYSMLVDGPILDPDVGAVVDEKASIELSKFYVARDRHGSGVAAALMAATLEAAASTGALHCWLGVNQRNGRAARFYEKSGFSVVGTKRFRVGAQWHDDHVRTRPLHDLPVR
ncbi:GNAT family N-acetyltransferase [Mangrovihabitans endophyticus]|uniref:N-acetyltransferase n=1 Tax=Mangrovihabitans endophyticus TaxID=1751298 RepID=A0A8J3C0R2_9ACTN|nr:GNAT family N-acetyltransferase [Mangrovihabitans endophyticus]GGL02280.1 N-acetyltransferase [Mangrovihabitans endophyticus]